MPCSSHCVDECDITSGKCDDCSPGYHGPDCQQGLVSFLLRKKSFLVFELSNVNFINCPLDQDGRKLKKYIKYI